jgi:hypothetical protein
MKLIPLFLLVGMLAVSGWAEEKITYSPELVQKAEAGNAEAEYNLGACYYDGEGVTKDYEKAVEWLERRPSRTIRMHKP